MKHEIGFVGLGIMGKPMANNLLEAGYRLVVHDIRAERLAEALHAGAEPADCPRAVAESSDVIITMLPDSPDVEAAALGHDGLIEGAHEGQIYIDMSTIAPATSVNVAEEFGKKGVRCLDAPVSGGETGAINASLSIMVGGDEEVYQQTLPVLSALGKTITLCGGHGAGQIVKASNQIQVALNLIGMAEALTLASKAGVDSAIVLRVLAGGYAQCRVMDVRGPKVIRGEFDPGFKARFHVKDLNIILQTATALKCPLPASALARELFNALLASGGGDLDHSAVVKVLEDLAKTSVTSKRSEAE
jgi:2-hydroxy-3-oxopropionate reductase